MSYSISIANSALVGKAQRYGFREESALRSKEVAAVALNHLEIGLMRPRLVAEGPVVRDMGKAIRIAAADELLHLRGVCCDCATEARPDNRTRESVGRRHCRRDECAHADVCRFLSTQSVARMLR